MTGNAEKLSFTSYIEFPKTAPVESNKKKCVPKLFKGEIDSIAADVEMVENITKNDSSGIPGKLFLTNFKLSFVPYDPANERLCYQQNRILRHDDITLSNIDTIYQIVDKKKRKIEPQQKVDSKVDTLLIICKNFRWLKFNFISKDEGTLMASALLLFAFPSRNDLSFAFRYDKISAPENLNVKMFNEEQDWIDEIKRCGAKQWKILSTNTLSNSAELEPTFNSCILPKYIVIPKCLNEKDFLEYASSFNDHRSAFWVYSYNSTGASLVRMGELRSYKNGRTIEDVTLEKVRSCDPAKKSLEFLNLSELPNSTEVHQSYLKLRELCTPDSIREFMVQDSRYYSLLDKCGWMKCVSFCLKYALKVSECLRMGTTVVIQEFNGREMCCVISSLAQILLDPHYRSLVGFQSLIQKDWVALEHPFSDTLGHIWKKGNSDRSSVSFKNNLAINSFASENSSTTKKECPLLLLFLDCVWQLLQQFPTEFEFTETYLTTIWDSAFLPIFDTFQFNSEYDRQCAVIEKQLTLRPVWDWHEQFSDADISLFYNPLYIASRSFIKQNTNYLLTENTCKTNYFEHNLADETFLIPECAIQHLNVWQQCYFRWIPILEIKCGGSRQIDSINRSLLVKIFVLQKYLEKKTIKIKGDFIYNFNKIRTPFFEFSNYDIKSFQETEEKIDRVIKQRKNCLTNRFGNVIPFLNSFFPFSNYNNNFVDLNEMLIL